MICSIHQPNLFPWLGYFAKIAKADVFVFLDAVQFPRSSRGTWTNRVKILTSGNPVWLTCPIKRNGTDIIANIGMAEPEKWKTKTLRTLAHSYGKSPFYGQAMELLAPIFDAPTTRLSEFNILAITSLSKALNLQCSFICHSELGDDTRTTSGSERLANICKEVRAKTYLAGDGADGYEKPEAYEQAGIELANNQFTHPTYPQTGSREFVSGLSVLDAIFNLGFAGTHRLLTD